MQSVLICTAVALLCAAAAGGGWAIARVRRAGGGSGERRALFVARVLAPAMAVVGWVVLIATMIPVLGPPTGDTVAGTAVPAAPGLIPAAAVTTPTSTKPVAPDPMSLLKPGDCVEVPMERTTDAQGRTAWQPGSPVQADCNTVDANYRVLQTGPGACTDPLYKLESSRRDRSGNLIYHLCLGFDWRAGFCYDTADMDEPAKVACGTRGANVVQVTAVLTDTTSGANCPRDDQGAVWVVWDKRRMTVCFRGSDTPGH